VLPQLTDLRKSLDILLLVDNEKQITFLEEAQSEKPWNIFIKLDVGARRAGVDPGSPALRSLVSRAEASSAVNVYGFYCHANHSYGGKTRAEAESMLNHEVESLVGAAQLVPHRKLVLSLGATPTAHVVKSLQAKIPDNAVLELHAGNYPCNDLQQVSTGVVDEADQAGRVIADVCSVYPERNEALVNAGVTALSRETSPAYPGFGRVIGNPGWGVVRMSQEHGIIGQVVEGGKEGAEKTFEFGQRLHLYCNHICITAAAFHVYFMVDEDDIVRETWVPWKGW
jgi:D-serine deaminase-like pyridoxal phosphate-dependent protein